MTTAIFLSYQCRKTKEKMSYQLDDSKFGQKLMEKMGWSKGQGLGANKDGNPVSVAVSVKTDNKGIGWTQKSEDNWIAHQDDFNSLLSSLNKSHGTDKGSTDSPDTKKVLNLEQTSRSSKGRVHYKKFTKGKDLSSRTEKDLDCVFGKRKSKGSTEERVLDTPEVTQPLPDESENSSGLNTVTSTDSIQAYFAKKMAALKNKRNNPSIKNNIDSDEHINEDMNSNNFELNQEQKGREFSDKGKKRKYESFQFSYDDNEVETNNSKIEHEAEKTKKAKKKTKVRFSLGNDIVEPNCDVREENVNELAISKDSEIKKKKKKSKKEKKELEIDYEEINDNKDSNLNDGMGLNEDEAGMLTDSVMDDKSESEANADSTDNSKLNCGVPNGLDEITQCSESMANKNSKGKKSKKKDRKKEKAASQENVKDLKDVTDTICDKEVNKSDKKSKSLDKKFVNEETDSTSNVTANVEKDCEHIDEVTLKKNKKRKRKKTDDDLDDDDGKKMKIEHETDIEGKQGLLDKILRYFKVLLESKVLDTPENNPSLPDEPENNREPENSSGLNTVKSDDPIQLMSVDELVNPFPTRKPDKVLLEYAKSNNMDVKFVMTTTGPGHKPVHTLHVELGERKFNSVQCGTKKEAKKKAAITALFALYQEGHFGQTKGIKEKVKDVAVEKTKEVTESKTEDRREETSDSTSPGSYFPGSCLDNIVGYPGLDTKPMSDLVSEDRGKKKFKRDNRRKEDNSLERGEYRRFRGSFQQNSTDRGGYRRFRGSFQQNSTGRGTYKRF